MFTKKLPKDVFLVNASVLHELNILTVSKYRKYYYSPSKLTVYTVLNCKGVIRSILLLPTTLFLYLLFFCFLVPFALISLIYDSVKSFCEYFLKMDDTTLVLFHKKGLDSTTRVWNNNTHELLRNLKPEQS